MQKKNPKMTVGIVGIALTMGLTAATRADNLTVNGKTTAADTKTVGGSVYVKLSDVAKAMGMSVVKRAGGYELTKPGGANQVNGDVTGKIGDVLFDGRWRFAVLSMETAETYPLKTSGEPGDDGGATHYDNTKRVITPVTGNKLVILHCRISNGQKTSQTFWMAKQNSNTALTNTEGESYPPSDYDIAGGPIQTKSLLPGSKIEFPLVFSIPENAAVKDLVFTLRNNNYLQKGNDVRVSLGAQ